MSVVVLRSGRTLSLDPLDVSAVTIEDVAVALARLPRFLGHTRVPYSVAEHSVRVAMRLPPDLQLQGLLHDVHEIACAGVPVSLKALPAMAPFRDLEQALQRALLEHFGCDPDLDPLVHAADLAQCRAEIAALMVDPTSQALWGPLTPGPSDLVALEPFSEVAARQWFLATFWELTFGREND